MNFFGSLRILILPPLQLSRERLSD